MMTSVFLAVLRSPFLVVFFSLLRLDQMIGTIDDGLTTLIHTQVSLPNEGREKDSNGRYRMTPHAKQLRNPCSLPRCGAQIQHPLRPTNWSHFFLTHNGTTLLCTSRLVIKRKMT